MLISSRKSEDINQRDLCNIYQMEIDRLKYAMTCYLRTRIQKVEKNARFLSVTPEAQSRLSTSEIKYMTDYLALVNKCVSSLLLERMPEHLRDLEEKEMVENRNLEQYVIIYVEENLRFSEGEEYVELSRGDVMVIKLALVLEFILDKKVRLM